MILKNRIWDDGRGGECPIVDNHCPVSIRRRAPVEARPGIEPGCKDLQSSASPLRHRAPYGNKLRGKRGLVTLPRTPVNLRRADIVAAPPHRLRGGAGACRTAARNNCVARLKQFAYRGMMLSDLPSFETMRHAMVASQLRTNAVNDARVVAAMAQVPREQFVTGEARTQVYRDAPVPLGGGRALNLPMATGRLLTEAGIGASDRVLLIGAAGGYTAALLAQLAASVTAVEEDATLAAFARAALAQYPTVELVEGPLNAGAPDGAPYDLLIIDGAVEAVPAALVEQVRPAAGSRPASSIAASPGWRSARAPRAASAFRISPTSNASSCRFSSGPRLSVSDNLLFSNGNNSDAVEPADRGRNAGACRAGERGDAARGAGQGLCDQPGDYGGARQSARDRRECTDRTRRRPSQRQHQWRLQQQPLQHRLEHRFAQSAGDRRRRPECAAVHRRAGEEFGARGRNTGRSRPVRAARHRERPLHRGRRSLHGRHP